MLILGLTSSTASVGVALASDGLVIASRSAITDRRHAEELTPMLVEVLAEAGLRVQDLDRLAVDIGPGRFTGLRVGLATARALALATDKPLFGLSSLALLGGAEAHPVVVAVIDARRNEVFQQAFADGDPIEEPRVGPPSELAQMVPEKAVLVGDGADRYREIYAGKGTLLDGRHPSADVLVVAAADQPGRPGSEVEPLYLREPDVQINIKTRLNTLMPTPRTRRRTEGGS